MQTESRLLLAEDEAPVAEPLVELLNHAGHTVQWVRSSRELRAAMADWSPDLLLLDLSLDVDGLEYLQAIRFDPAHPRAGVVALAEEVSHRERALQLGAVAAIPKPVNGEALTGLIEELLAVR